VFTFTAMTVYFAYCMCYELMQCLSRVRMRC